ncbi:MAG TPA: PIN domain-containing protein [Armatimonadota bacterium]|jgi:predicted nucleic acid-binding protein
MGRLTIPRSGLVYGDTVTVIYAVEEHPVFWATTVPIWEAARRGDVEAVSSELTLLEAMVGPEKSGSLEMAAAYETFFEGGVRLIPISKAILRMAARLRANLGLKTPDAIHAATALSASCALFVTNDRQFRNVPGLNVALLADAV